MIRVLLNNLVYSVDATSFVVWAKYLASHPLSRLYFDLPGGYPPYPPLYYYILLPMGKAMSFLHVFNNQWLSLLIVKKPVFIAEILTTVFIYLFSKKHYGVGAAQVAS